MTITAQTSKTGPYSGNGTTTVFSYTFEVQEEAHLVVTLADSQGVETVQVLNTDYTVSGVGNANGGLITMSIAPAATYTLTISRNTPITQEVDLENRRSVAPEVLEDAYDKLTQIAQDLSEQLGRAIKISVTEGGNPTLTLEGDVQPGTFLGFDAAGNLAQLAPASGTFISPNAAIVAVDDFTGDGITVNFTLGGIPQSPNNLFIFLDGVMQDAANYTVSGTTLTFTTAPPLNTNIEVRRLQAVALTGGTTADLVTYSPAGLGAVTRTVQSRLRDFVSVKDFGAVGDGVTDDTVAIQTAVDYALQNEVSLQFSSGVTYRITSEINFPKYHAGVIRKWISFDGGGSTILIEGAFTAFGHTATGVGLDSTNYYLIFENFCFKSTQGNGAIAIRPAGFVTAKYINLYFQDVDYPFWQEISDPRGTPDYVQSPHVLECYAYRVQRFWTGTQVYDAIFDGTMVDVGVDGIRLDRGSAFGQSGFDCSITNCIFQSLSGIALHLGGIQGLVVSDNYFENNGREYVAIHTTTKSDGGVYWTYQYAETAWTTSASIAVTGDYRVNASKIYVSRSIGVTGATAPTHTSGTVSDGGVDWAYVGAYSAWGSGQTISTIGEFRSNASKIYAAQTTGTTGATAPTQVNGTVYSYGGVIEGNFNQPKSPSVVGRKAMFDLGENPSTGMRLGGNVTQDQNLYAYSRYSSGFWDTIGDRTAMKTDTLYDPAVRPDDARIIFSDSYRWGLLWGQDGGIVMNLQSRGMEFTNVEYDYLDPITNKRVPIVHGVAQVTPPGFGFTGAFPPSTYPTIYPQKPWARGSYLANPTPTVAGTAGSQYIIQGWMCTVSGTPGTWVECRTLTGT